MFFALMEWALAGERTTASARVYPVLSERIHASRKIYESLRTQYFNNPQLNSSVVDRPPTVRSLSNNAKLLLQSACRFARAINIDLIDPDAIAAGLLQMKQGRVLETFKALNLDSTELRRVLRKVAPASLDDGDLERPPSHSEKAEPTRTYVSNVLTDDPRASADDFLKVSDEVNAFANLVASRNIFPPLAIGIFGEWGSGKTFFMERMKDAVDRISKNAAHNHQMFHDRIVQIQFNAWHYIETNLWASLVEYIFRELDTWLRGEEKDVEALFEQLSTSKQLKLSAVSDLIEQRKALRAAEEEFRDAREAHDRALKQRADSPWKDIMTAAINIFQTNLGDEDKCELQRAADDLGLMELDKSAAELSRLVTDSKNQIKRAHLIGNSLLCQLGSLKYVFLTAAVILLIPLAVEVVRAAIVHFDDKSWVTNVNAVVLGLASFIASVTVAGGWLLRRATSALTVVDKFRTKFDDAVAEATRDTRSQVLAS
jgi:KAP-like P-loop domain-containing protein